MNLLVFISGAIITCLTIYDIIYTTFAPSGGSFISGRVTTYTWRVILAISRLTKKRSILNGGGIIIICTILISWVLLIWLGNALIFSSDPNAVLHSNTKEIADLPDRIYYAGYVLSTLGNGDFSAGSSNWQIYTAALSFFGLMLITIAISYMVPVISAVTDRRTLSIQIATLGHSPQAILLNHWNGEDFRNLERNLNLLHEKIALHGQLHLSYPILQYFQNNEKLTALLPNLVAFDEALTILHFMVPEKLKPNLYVLEPMRIIVASFFDSLACTTDFAKTQGVPPIKTRKLRESGIPLLPVPDEARDEINSRRLLINKILENSGWHWDEIYEELQSTRFS